MKSNKWICIAGFMAWTSLALAAEKDQGLLHRIFGDQDARVITRNQLDLALSVRDYLGRDMVNAQGEHLGKIQDFIIKDASGEFDKVVVSSGGVLGLGEVLVAVPYDKVQHKAGTDNLVWDISKRDFQAMVDQAKHKTEKGVQAGKSKNAEVDKVVNAIQKHKDLASALGQIQFRMADGKMILEGHVPSPETKRRIIEVAQAAAACPVVDKLATN